MYTFTHDTAELADTAILTVPDTVDPLAGEVIFTTELVGVGVGVGVGVTLPLGVGVAPPFATVTVTESWPITPLPLYAATEMVCAPFGADVEFQVNVNGGDEAK